MIITIDGLRATGKTTLSRMISEQYNLKNFNTGAIYRCIALKIINEDLNVDNIDELIKRIENISINFIGDQVILEDENVSERIREEDISYFSTKWATIKEIKILVRKIQRDFGEQYDLVIEGRDIGTVVFPEAEIKFYLYSDFETRVKRLYEERKGKEKVTYEEISANLKEVDNLDINHGNFIKPKDAIEIKTDELSIDEVFQIMIKHINKKLL